MTFRPLRRIKQALSQEDCIELLKQEKRGVLSVLGDNGYPYGMPLNHFYNEDDGRLYFHAGHGGHREDSFLNHDKASYCVTQNEPKADTEWAWHVRSVIVFGRIELITDTAVIYDIARRLSRKFTSDKAYIENEIQKSGPGTAMFVLIPEHISGKRVHER